MKETLADLKPKVEEYLSSVFGKRVSVLHLAELGDTHSGRDVKSYGYGTPVRVDYQAPGEQPKSAVLHTMSPGPFGHEHMSDRAQELLWEHRAFNRLPAHVRSLDVGGLDSAGNAISLGKVEEFCLLTEYAEGESYALDLQRLRDNGALTDLDLARAEALCDYLVRIHKVRNDDRGLYIRRVRELVGHGECIMGVTDSYPPHPMVPAGLLEKIEHLCVAWRWRLKSLPHRSRQIHGDFHPWNILFRQRTDFSVLDRSRGEFGDPADDVTSLSLNYLFFSLQRSGRLEGAFERLFLRFWDRYLDETGDHEMLKVAAPYFAFRGLVMANPFWYPSLPDQVRERLLAFVVAVLESDSFDPRNANRYCGA